MQEILAGALYGGLGGLCWAGLGFFRFKQKHPDEEFELGKFVKTLVIGAAVGVYAGYTGGDISIVATTPMAGSITAFVDKIWNMVAEKL